ncbi:helix-turn-helix domain-containing protein [Micromonospora trifolii]|uniref:helix-turn-helix domain-containing protein n=1 Tax=Micromonospora trifolii TaxID=2911208 RepID=UPI003CF449B2
MRPTGGRTSHTAGWSALQVKRSVRRTPGLRRQEVAQLAGMSIDYYIRLEQGRGPHPSRQVLAAMARALLLSRDEREYLFRITGENPLPAGGPSRDRRPTRCSAGSPSASARAPKGERDAAQSS